MKNKLNLDVLSIFGKEFPVDFKGYNPKEVDRYIDLMIEDYQTYQNIIDGMNQKKLRTRAQQRFTQSKADRT